MSASSYTPDAGSAIPDAGEISAPTVYDLAAQGRSIIPVNLDKRPMYGAWKEGQRRRPSVGQLRAWAEGNPPAWAVVTGAVSGIVTLDFDGAAGAETMGKLRLKPHRRTGSGGYHVDFIHPGWLVPIVNGKSKRELGERYPGLDMKGDGGYVIVLGRNAKEPYQWLGPRDPYPLDILPDELREFLGLLRQPDDTRPVQVQQELVPRGRRHPVLVSLAGTMLRRGMTVEAITAALLWENAASCQPPLPEAQVRQIVRDLVARYGGMAQDRRPKVEPPQTGGDLFEREVQPRSEIIQGLLREQQIAVCGGTYGVGKSPFLQDLAVRLVHGLPFCERQVEKRPVICFDHETPAAVFKVNVERICARLSVAVPSPEELEIYLEFDDPKTPATAALLALLKTPTNVERVEFLRKLLQKKPNAVVIVDPLEKLFRLDKRKETEVLDLYQEFRFLLADFPSAAIITSWNLRKRDKAVKLPNLLVSPREWLEEVSGSIEIMNRSDVRFGFDFNQRDPEIRVLNGVRRGEDFHPLLLRPVGLPGEEAGFDQVRLEGPDLALAFTQTQLGHWHGLPQTFKFDDIADRTVPRSSLSRLLGRADSLGLIVKHGATYEKRGPAVPPCSKPVSMNPADFV